MAPTHIGPGHRPTSFRPKNRTILATSARTVRGRAPVGMPVNRIGGVGAPSRSGPRPTGLSSLPAIEDAVALALETLELLQRRAHEVADGFRWSRVGEANRGLSEIVQSTGTLLRLAMAAAHATGADLAVLCTTHGTRIDQDTCSAVDRLIALQFANDWAGLADTLEDDFTPALSQWRFVFEALLSPDDDGGQAA